MDQYQKLLARAAGGVLFAFGIALAGMTVWVVDRQLPSRGTMEPIAFLRLIVLAGVAALCCLVGYRLAFNRPNRYGSLFSPIAWRILAAGFFTLGICLASLATSLGRYEFLAALLASGLLGYWCIVAARAAALRSRPSPVFSPETSLLGLDGFVPPGFRYGIEILNDASTPMKFVVSVLCKTVGLSEPDAVRTMLDIHFKGGVLLPMTSLDESKRIADAVTTEASGSNHALVCRCVSVEK